MRKVYIANSVIAFTLTVGGVRRRISFERLSNGKSYFSTSDSELQKALELFPDFEKEYWLEDFKKPEEVKEEQPELKNLFFTSAVSARDYLILHHGESTSTTKTVAKIIEVGKRHGFNITIE